MYIYHYNQDDDKNKSEYPVVGLVGKAGSGKDRFYYAHLAKYGYVKVALADPVKVLACHYLLNSIPLEKERDKWTLFASVYKSVFNPNKSSLIRTLLQQIGTEIGRNQIAKSYWIDLANSIVTEYLNRNIKVAITDVRFKDEAEWIKKIGGVIIKIEGDGMYNQSDPESQHPSETEIDNIPYDFTETEFKSIIDSMQK